MNPIHAGATPSRRRLLLGLAAAAVVGAGTAGCAQHRQRWVHGLGGPVGLVPGDGVVFASGADDTGRVSAIDVRNGETRWTYDLRGARGHLVTVDDLVIVGDRYGVHALDAVDGTRRWMREEAWAVGAGEGIALCGRRPALNAFVLTAVDAASGEERWTVPLGGSSYTPVAIAAGRVHLGVYDLLRTLDAVTGATVWEQPLRDSTRSAGITVGGPVVCCAEEAQSGVSLEDRVKFGSVSQVGFDAATGRQLWRRPDEGEWTTAHAGTHYICAGSTSVVAWDAATGGTRWTAYSLDMTPDAAPVVTGDSCYVASSWVSRDRIYRDVLEMHLTVVALAADTGKPRWSAETDLGPYPGNGDEDGSLALTVVGDTVVVGAPTGTVVGIA
ncbi:PQQ-binding-like beta-propeller repeat protein [Pseudonocardia sp. DSM 110487]|uniref:PQQ-binding-like beta-propeller repeat protein n=1 Tax=Pseudonocardia sp. DSM 110487 TaxID=2865833 RepID=UPI001C69A571|nr:PQQ-like beta-propeller repeat protein [Pseudonocardia sp. DSM 110487]QYN37744.1 PQQ-binding-like beta-propeller repeat protein [Pseudonocardia sp. DSM 110487]